jgi:hypothetical protein
MTACVTDAGLNFGRLADNQHCATACSSVQTAVTSDAHMRMITGTHVRAATNRANQGVRICDYG